MINWIKNLFIKILLWNEERKLYKELDNELTHAAPTNTPFTVEEKEIQRKYQEGTYLLKQNLKKQASLKGGLRGALSQYKGQDGFYTGSDLLSLAKRPDETKVEKIIRDTKTNNTVYQGTDIKTAEDHDKMIDKRIAIMYDVQRDRVKRKLLADIRKAKQNNDLQTLKTLEDKFYAEYGSESKSNTRRS